MLLAALLLLQAAPACPAAPVIQAELAGWSAAVPVVAGRTVAAAAPLPGGRGARVVLAPATAVTLPVAPGKAAPLGTSSGVVSFTVPERGRYRVALAAGAWVDVVADGKALPSVAHGHGPACSPIRKQVDFDLQPGRYLLQVVGSRTATLDLMVARLR